MRMCGRGCFHIGGPTNAGGADSPHAGGRRAKRAAGEDVKAQERKSARATHGSLAQMRGIARRRAAHAREGSASGGPSRSSGVHGVIASKATARRPTLEGRVCMRHAGAMPRRHIYGGTRTCTKRACAMAGYLAVRACFNADCTQARSAASGPRDAVANRIKRRNGRLSAKHSTAAHPVAHSRHPEISPIPLTYAVILSISI